MWLLKIYICVYIYIYMIDNFHSLPTSTSTFNAKTPHRLVGAACHSKFPWPCGRNAGSVVHPSDRDLVHRDCWSESQPFFAGRVVGGSRWWGRWWGGRWPWWWNIWICIYIYTYGVLLGVFQLIWKICSSNWIISLIAGLMIRAYENPFGFP